MVFDQKYGNPTEVQSITILTIVTNQNYRRPSDNSTNSTNVSLPFENMNYFPEEQELHIYLSNLASNYYYKKSETHGKVIISQKVHFSDSRHHGDRSFFSTKIFDFRFFSIFHENYHN